MALTADQNAMLELLLRSGQDYEALGELLGLSEGEVRARAREALGQLGGADPDRNVGLTDYLLGQADPIGRADAARHLRSDPADLELARAIVERLREIDPGAELPKLPSEPGAPPAAAPRIPRRPRTRPVLASRRSRMLAALGAGAIVLVVVILAVAGVFGGGEETAATEPPPGSTTPAATGDIPPGEELVRIPLRPVGNGDARGEAAVGITDADQPYLDLSLSRLEPAPQGQVYVIWFLFDDETGYPLSPFAPDNRGRFQDRFAIPGDAIPLVQRARFVNVSLAPIDQVQATIRQALEEEQLVIQRPGRSIMQGRVPAQGGGQDEG